MENENLIHGPSVVRVLPYVEEHLYAISDENLKNPEFEFVYASIEEFEDGYACKNVCYRVPDPHWKPAKGAGKRPLKTFLAPVVWDTVERMREAYPCAS